MEVNEKNFVDKLKERDEESLIFIVKEYGPLVKAVVSKMLYNLKGIQDECINDIFLGIWNNINKFDEKRGTFKNWVIGISKYKSIDYKRKYLKENENVEYDSLNIGVGDNAAIEILKQESRQEIDELLSCLNEKDRDIFIKHFFKDMGPSEIAEDLGVKTSFIYNRLSRGKKKIRQMKGLF